jgi:hypothetical protein
MNRGAFMVGPHNELVCADGARKLTTGSVSMQTQRAVVGR